MDESTASRSAFVIVVVLLCNVHGKHLRSYLDVQLTKPHCSGQA